MSAQPTTEQLLKQVIAVLAEACKDADRRGLGARHLAMAHLAARSDRMRPLAERVVRCAGSGDYGGIDVLLARQRTPREWRELALALAFVAAGRDAEAAGWSVSRTGAAA